jgi:hypothetical protein
MFVKVIILGATISNYITEISHKMASAPNSLLVQKPII